MYWAESPEYLYAQYFAIKIMGISIHLDSKIPQIEKEFHQLFPFLKLKFKSFARKNGSVNPLIEGNGSLRHYRDIEDFKDYQLSPDMKVKEVEAFFREHFDLIVEVQRLSGNAWIETSMTKDWTLGEQNEQGKNLSQL